jgi:arylsulfatase
VPVQNKLKAFLPTIPNYPFQQGSRMNAAGINDQTLKAAEILKHLNDV